MHNDGMKRTTIMADQQLLHRLRRIASAEGVSLAEIIRRALEGFVTDREQGPAFVGVAASPLGPSDTGRRSGDECYEPWSWR
jgi:hypothetical protein